MDPSVGVPNYLNHQKIYPKLLKSSISKGCAILRSVTLLKHNNCSLKILRRGGKLKVPISSNLSGDAPSFLNLRNYEGWTGVQVLTIVLGLWSPCIGTASVTFSESLQKETCQSLPRFVEELGEFKKEKAGDLKCRRTLYWLKALHHECDLVMPVSLQSSCEQAGLSGRFGTEAIEEALHFSAAASPNEEDLKRCFGQEDPSTPSPTSAAAGTSGGAKRSTPVKSSRASSWLQTLAVLGSMGAGALAWRIRGGWLPTGNTTLGRVLGTLPFIGSGALTGLASNGWEGAFDGAVAGALMFPGMSLGYLGSASMGNGDGKKHTSDFLKMLAAGAGRTLIPGVYLGLRGYNFGWAYAPSGALTSLCYHVGWNRFGHIGSNNPNALLDGPTSAAELCAGAIYGGGQAMALIGGK